MVEINNSYWHVYYDSKTIERSEALRQEYCIESSDVILHVDAYQRPDPSAPVILLTHGEGSYSRMFVHPALALYERGYTVLVLDQRGHGYSLGRQADFTLSQLAQDVLDAAFWARRSFSGPIFLGGANQGGALAYQASARGAPVVGLILHQLYDFTSPENLLRFSHFAPMAGLPGGVQVASAAARTLMAISPRMRLSLESPAGYAGILDERDNGHYEAWLEDPHPARQVSIRYAVSTFSTPPDVPYENNALPALVINPTRDRMVDPAITRINYQRLSGPKTYVEIDYGHWSMLETFAQEWSGVVDGWVKGLLG